MSETPATPCWYPAMDLAARAHEGHLRKDGCTPYIAHPARVALTLAVIFGCFDERILAAAALHDTLEDTRVDYDDLAAHFGVEVADMVSALSKDPRRPEPEREVAYDEGLAAGPVGARLIKLADVHDNLLGTTEGSDRRRRALDRARRALALSQDDPECAEARRIVAALVARLEPPA